MGLDNQTARYPGAFIQKASFPYSQVHSYLGISSLFLCPSCCLLEVAVPFRIMGNKRKAMELKTKKKKRQENKVELC